MALTTDGSGDVVGTTPPIRGILRHIRYVKTDYAAGVDFDIVGAVTGIVIWSEDDVNASVTKSIQDKTHYTDGALWEDTGYANVTPIFLNEPLTITVGSGGASKVGTFYITVEN